MSFSELEHYSNMISGCESINSVTTQGGALSPDGVYAFTVLKLHASDAGLLAGSESFMENVKAGAKKGKEWIIAFFKALRDYITGGYKGVVDKLKKVSGIKEHDAIMKAAKESFGESGSLTTAFDSVAKDDKIPTELAKKAEELSADTKEISQLAEKGNESDSGRITKLIESVMNRSKELSESLAKKWESFSDKEKDESAEASAISKAGVKIANAFKAMVDKVSKFISKISKYVTDLVKKPAKED